MNDVTKFSKHFSIGELDFSIAVNRAIAVDGFKKYPQYYDAVLQNELLTNSIENNGKSLEVTNAKELIQCIETAEQVSVYSKKIVDYLLPTLLKYAETPLPQDITTYDDYAHYIISYCNENDILEDYIEIKVVNGVETDEENIVKGLYSLVIEFISMGFTQGNTKKKGKLKIIMN